MATDKRAAKRKLEELLMEMSRHRSAQETYRNEGDAAGVARCKQILKLDYAGIGKHCARHDLELPHDVPSEGAE